MPKLLKDLLQYELEYFANYLERGKLNIEMENTNPNFTTFHLLCELLEILVYSKNFTSMFHQSGGSKCLLSFFEHKPLMAYMTASMTQADQFRADRKMDYNKALASILSATLELRKNRISEFRRLNAVEILTAFSNRLSIVNIELIFRTHLVLDIVALDHQIERLDNMHRFIIQKLLIMSVGLFYQVCLINSDVEYFSYKVTSIFGDTSFKIYTNGFTNTFKLNIFSAFESFITKDNIIIPNNCISDLIKLLKKGTNLEKLNIRYKFKMSFNKTSRKRHRQIFGCEFADTFRFRQWIKIFNWPKLHDQRCNQWNPRTVWSNWLRVAINSGLS